MTFGIYSNHWGRTEYLASLCSGKALDLSYRDVGFDSKQRHRFCMEFLSSTLPVIVQHMSWQASTDLFTAFAHQPSCH